MTKPTKESAVQMAEESGILGFVEECYMGEGYEGPYADDCIYRLVLAAYNKALDDAAAKCREIALDWESDIALDCVKAIESMKE